MYPKPKYPMHCSLQDEIQTDQKWEEKRERKAYKTNAINKTQIEDEPNYATIKEGWTVM